MQNRLNEKIQRTLFEKCFDLLSVIAVIVILIFIYLKWSTIPSQIPMKYDSDGGISQWGSKKSILGLPVLGILAWIVFSFFERFPQNINLRMFRSDDMDKETKYNRIIVNAIKNVIVICLILTNWKIIRSIL
ncbi:DUF1648 domain-containing protein [Falsibacillus pallidus]|uniref:DUF1648 domain-containing protein n=1 Tax=Falsibacillus pallidus TaxID=493781 RepID=UPI003D97A6E4